MKLRARRTDVEPHRGVEAEVLMDQQPGQLLTEDLGVLLRGEVAVFTSGRHVGLDDAVDEGLETVLTDRSAQGATEVLVRDDRRGVDAPEVGELDSALFEDYVTGAPVRLHDVATLPRHLVVGMDTLGAEGALDVQPLGAARPAWCGLGLGHGSL